MFFTVKALLRYADVFADIANALLFDGEQRILPNELTEVDPHTYYNDKQRQNVQIQDIVKYWKVPCTLHERLDIPTELKPYVSDYRINIFDIAYLSEDTVSKFQSDFQVVADYFVQKRLKKRLL